MPPPSPGTSMALMMPGKAVRIVMLVVFTIWLSFALGLNYGSVDQSVFLALVGNTDAILHGEVWRLFTAPLMHFAQGRDGFWHIVGTLLGLFFLAPRLEEIWGPWRFVRFLAISCVSAYLLQMGVALVLPPGLSERLVAPFWFGLGPALAAVAIAWALTFKNQTVYLFMFIPATSRVLVASMIGLGLIAVFAGVHPFEGLIAPFGGMLCGWLLGGGSPSPLRKAWLKLRLSRLEKQGAKARRRPRANPGGLRVIPGGRADDDEDKGPDGRWLN